MKAEFTGWTCVEGPADLVDFLVEHGEEVNYRTFSKHVDVKTANLENWQIRMLPKDWSVTWLKTRLPSGEEAWVMQHSGIEYLATQDGDFNRNLETQLALEWANRDDDVESNPPRDWPVYTNPECFDGPDVSEYEGMHVQYKVGDLKFPKVSEALDFVKFSDKLGLFEDVRERVYAVYLSTANKIIGYRLVSAGAIDASLADPKVIFGPALTLHAKSVALMHNHPSKSLTFSTQDEALAKKLISGGEMLDIALLDFVVVGDGKFLSLREEMPGLFPG